MVGNAVDVMDSMESDFVDLTVTSPPYDNLRDYNGYSFDFESIANGLFRITKPGGIVIWVVGDKTIKGNRTLTSFRQAIYFQEIGFNVHDVMIYRKKNTPFMRSNAYTNCFEFMFVFSKGSPEVFNPIMEPTVRSGNEMLVSNKKSDGVNSKVLRTLNAKKVKTNVWDYAVGMGGSTRDKIAFKHPAIFPEKLVSDHISTWTNPGDFVFDPMCGSGTTMKVAAELNRNYFGCDISQDYVELANERLSLMKENDVRGF